MKKVALLLVCVSSFLLAKSTVIIDVDESRPIYEIKKVVEQVKKCDDNSATDNIIGTVVGAVGGGVLGNKIGGGTGKTMATIAGSVLGGYAGNKVEGSIKKDSGCYYVNETKEQKVLVGYKNIGYYKGKQYSKITEAKQNKIKIQAD
ncbi:glycine zipper 2TM domain-containing protein [Campylobacter geochelonis]|uniref:Surface antigen n=1 Tax=Campylobacter geochelonis TaxID=1780362 RepID=A0A128EIM6_9BACT|nr:glycine zipper 2TM domain-containing protein [Campylobacter geochelonis]QKF71618.1 hypothetical protein CGEO_1325 [Campylobacter geochelonis]CZE48710.1 Surface antigen [Campylobacter geochelonis]